MSVIHIYLSQNHSYLPITSFLGSTQTKYRGNYSSSGNKFVTFPSFSQQGMLLFFVYVTVAWLHELHFCERRTHHQKNSSLLLVYFIIIFFVLFLFFLVLVWLHDCWLKNGVVVIAWIVVYYPTVYVCDDACRSCVGSLAWKCEWVVNEYSEVLLTVSSLWWVRIVEFALLKCHWFCERFEGRVMGTGCW